MPAATLDSVNGAAADGLTLKWNREAYDRIRLRPRVLVDATRLDTPTLLFGRELRFPVLLAPTGAHKTSHPEGELATARRARAAGATMGVSTMATAAVEDIAAAATGPPWFPLCVLCDRGFTRELVRRAEDAGCRALCLTVDTPVTGPRNRQTRGAGTAGPLLERPHLRGPQGAPGGDGLEIFSGERAPDLTWRDVDWLPGFARVPLLLKGILTAADARRALQAGAAGIIVSNHGGRNLDTAPAAIDALPEVAAEVAGRVPFLVDGGIRRGTDIVKAVALGARAVMVGRPCLWALGAAGAARVERVLQILRTELEMAMALTGRLSLADIDASVLWETR